MCHQGSPETAFLLELEERRKDDGLVLSWFPGLELLKSWYFCIKLSLQKSTFPNSLGMQNQGSGCIEMKGFIGTKLVFATLLLRRAVMLKSLRVFSFYKVIIFRVKKVQVPLPKTSWCKRNEILLYITQITLLPLSKSTLLVEWKPQFHSQVYRTTVITSNVNVMNPFK